jgi:hypothetical protein
MFQLLVNIQRCYIKACNSIWSVEPVKIVTFYFIYAHNVFEERLKTSLASPMAQCQLAGGASIWSIEPVKLLRFTFIRTPFSKRD